MKKWIASAIVVVVTGATTFIACGGSGGGGGDDGPDVRDAAAMTDGNSGPNSDAATADGNGNAPSGLGDACTPSSGGGSGQGDCPPGYSCLALQGATHPWCSKVCTEGAGDTCGNGYTGPGVAGCIQRITFGSAASMSYCGITCAGDGVNGCTTSTCTGDCPSNLMCSAPLLDGSGNAIGSACQ